MAVFSVNQVNQFYVANATTTGKLTGTEEVGTISLRTTADGDLYFSYNGAGGLIRSDLINKNNIIWANAKNASASAVHHRVYSIAFGDVPKDLDGDKIINESDVALIFDFHNYMIDSDEDQYQQIVTFKKKPTDEEAAKAIYKTFNKNGVDPAVDVYVDGKKVIAVAGETVTYATAATDGIPAKGLVVAGAVPAWRRGIMSYKPANFNIRAIETKDVASNFSMNLGSAFETDFNPEGKSTFIDGYVTVTREEDFLTGNGQNIADMEYFFMGSRADLYRGVNWPNNIETTYLVDPTKEYHTLQIHFAFTDTGVAVQKSEKDITIVSDSDAVINALVTALNTEANLSITKV